MNRAPAAVLEAFGKPLVIREYPEPKSLEPGSAWIRTEMAGICGTDVHLWRGELPIQLPVILGHETVGRIEALGEGLDRDWSGNRLSIGDRVTWTSTASCGRCFYCRVKHQPTRCPERRAYGIGYRSDQPPHFLGGYAARHYLKPGVHMFRVPDALTCESVIGAGCALVTALHGIERTALEPGDQVVVQGAGPVGIAAVAVARAAGAGRILVIGDPEQRLETARRFSADTTISLKDHPDPKDRLEIAREWSGGYGADAVLECTGVPQAVPEGMELCRDGGKLLVLGQYCDAGPVALNPHVITRKQLQIFGSWSSEPRHMKQALDFLARPEFPFQRLITHRFPVEEAARALETVARQESDKTVIVP